MNRRSFLSTLAGAAAFAMDPERLLWVPKLISIPKATRVEIGDDDVTVTAFYNKPLNRQLIDISSCETPLNFKEYMVGLIEYTYIPVSDPILVRGGRDLLKSYEVEIPINQPSTITHIEVRQAKTGLLCYTYAMGERHYAVPGDELKFHSPFIQRVPHAGGLSWPLHMGGSVEL